MFELVTDHRRQAQAPGGRRPRLGTTKAVVEAFVGDLVDALSTKPWRHLFRSWQAAGFGPGSAGYPPIGGRRVANGVRDALLGLGLIQMALPHRRGVWTTQENGTRRREPDQSTTYAVTPAFAALAGLHGVNGIRHFLPLMPAVPIELSVEPPRRRQGDREEPEAMPIPGVILQTPIVRREVDQLRSLNEFLDGKALRHPDGTPAFRGLRRIFKIERDRAQDLPGYGWNRYGRLHDKGRRSFQSLSRNERLQITIDGEPVAECDLRASHLTALYGWFEDKKKGLLIEHDPYRHIFDRRTRREFPRDIVKAAVTPLISTTGNQFRAWPAKTAEKLAGKFPNLDQDFPAQLVGEAVLKLHSVIGLWKRSPWGPLDLMWREANVMLAVMLQAQERGIACFPIHDSFLVAERHAQQASSMLTDAFDREFRVRPFVKISRAATGA